MTALRMRNLAKTYRSKGRPAVEALKNVSLEIPEGAIYGLLGPNGAGKSTMIGIMSGVLAPTSGTVEVFGLDVAGAPEETKRLMGVVPQELVIEPAFTVEEVLYYYAGMFGVPRHARMQRIGEVLADLELADKRHERAIRLSGGMKRRVMIAKAIMHKPKFLILDEPTAGVDVALRQKIWELVRRVNAEGTTILFTTHYLEEAERLCESVAVINHGAMVTEGTVKDIQRQFSAEAIRFALYRSNVDHLPNVRKSGDEFELPVHHLENDMLAVLRHYGDNLKTVRKDVASLEQIFLDLTR